MENTVSVHVVNSFEDLVHVVLDTLFWQVVPPSFDCFVHVHVHQFKDQGQSTRWFITAHKKFITVS